MTTRQLWKYLTNQRAMNPVLDKRQHALAVRVVETLTKQPIDSKFVQMYVDFQSAAITEYEKTHENDPKVETQPGLSRRPQAAPSPPH